MVGLNKLSQIYNHLLNKKIITDVFNMNHRFYDEPPLFFYLALSNKDYSFYARTAFDFTPTGVSFFDRKTALLRCLMEAIEKPAFFFFDLKKMIFDTNEKIAKSHINANIYWKNVSNKSWFTDSQNKKIGWVEGVNMTNKEKGLIPAQLIYPNYISYMLYEKNVSESRLINQTQTTGGTAAGFDEESTLLRATYELIERDCKTTFLLAHAFPKKIKLEELKNTNIQEVQQLLFLFGFKLFVFDITNDLEIPTFLSIVLDLSGVGPIASFGIRTGLDVNKSILESIEDAFYTRFFDRLEMINKNKRSLLVALNGINIFGHQFNKKVWINKRLYKKLNYFFKIVPDDLDPTKFKATKKTTSQLAELIGKLKEKKFDLWYKKIEKKLPDGLRVYLYKAIIPGIQPALDDNDRGILFSSRINAVKNYYKRQ